MSQGPYFSLSSGSNTAGSSVMEDAGESVSAMIVSGAAAANRIPEYHSVTTTSGNYPSEFVDEGLFNEQHISSTSKFYLFLALKVRKI